MEKKAIETFIKKYHLGGAIEGARWVVENKTLKTSAMPSDKKMMAVVEMPNFDGFEDVELAVPDTSRLKSMLNIVLDQVDFTLVKDEEDDTRVTSMLISSGGREVNYVTADVDVVPDVPAMKALPKFDVEIKLTDDFVSWFLTAKANLPESKLFTLVMSKKKQKLEMVIGYSNINNNRASIEIVAEDGKNKVSKPIHFNAEMLKAIIQANADVKDTVLKVSEKGLATVDCSTPEFKVQYFLIKMDSEE